MSATSDTHRLTEACDRLGVSAGWPRKRIRAGERELVEGVRFLRIAGKWMCLGMTRFAGHPDYAA